MTTLILARDKDGSLAGRCDARCYNAKGDRCRCVCGGYNHGVGIDDAIENTHQYKDLLNDGQDAGEFNIRPGLLEFFPSSKSQGRQLCHHNTAL